MRNYQQIPDLGSISFRRMVWRVTTTNFQRNSKDIFAMAKAAARHILVETKEACDKIKADIAAGTDFTEAAKEHSQCPSGEKGGALGEFSPGQMVAEFDTVVFNEDVGVVHGPIQTQFGFHLIEITSRTD